MQAMQRVGDAPLPCLVRGTGPGLLLAHGGGGTAQSTYGSLITPLSRDFTVVAPDYSAVVPAAGSSAALDALVDQHLETAVSSGLDRFAVVGHSLGSMIAVRAAIRHPEHVTALVLTAGFAHVAMSTRLKMRLWRAMLGGDRELLSRYLMSVMFSDAYVNAMTQEQVDGFVELIGLTLHEGTTAQINLVLSLDLRGELHKVTVPTLVVATGADQLVPARMSEELAEGITGATLVELHCGHQPMLECAPVWRGLIKDFLAVEPVNAVKPADRPVAK